MAKTHLEDRKSYVQKSTCQGVEKDKTYFGDVMHMEGATKYEITFKRAVQKTVPLDVIFPTMRRDPDRGLLPDGRKDQDQTE